MSATMPVVHALVPAAGRGQRFGGSVAKQYLQVAGKPVMAHAIEAVSRYPQVAGITVVLAADDQLFGQSMGSCSQGVDTVTGGATRAQSVLNGLQSIRANHPDTQWVLVHDAARPCLPRECVVELLEKGLKNPDGAILAIPVQDSLKKSGRNGLIESTVDRHGLWAAQTPQLFPLDSLISALESMMANGETPTDEAGAMEYAGAKPLLVMGSPANIKITRPEDVVIAEAWIAANPGSGGAGPSNREQTD